MIAESFPLSSTFAGVPNLQAMNTQVTGNSSPSGIGDSVSIVNGTFRALVRDTDPLTFLGQRAEILATPEYSYGEKWYCYEVMIPNGWDDTRPYAIQQLHDSDNVAGRAPNWQLWAWKGQFWGFYPTSFPAGNGNATVVNLGVPIVKGQWYKMCLHYDYETVATGLREFFIDGVRVLSDYNIITDYDNSVSGGYPYFKLGIYNHQHLTGFGTIYNYYRNVVIWSGNDGYTTVLGANPKPKITQVATLAK